MPYRSDYLYSFCWYESDGYALDRYASDMAPTYPVKAFREFCAYRGTPYPLDIQKSVRTYTISQAVALMLELNYDWEANNRAETLSLESIRHGHKFTTKEHPAAPELQAWLHAQVKRCRNPEWPCYVLEGYKFANPLDVLSADRAEFPREAYYKLWLEHRMGINKPRWFDGLYSDRLPIVPALPDEVSAELRACSPPRDEVPPTAKTADTAAALAPVPAPGDDEELADGVTVADIRALFNDKGERYRAPLAEAVRLWASFERDGEIRRGYSVKQECESRLNDVRCSDGTESSARWSRNENAAILNLVNWDRTGNGVKQ